MLASDDATGAAGPDLAFRLREAAQASDVERALRLIRALVGDERLGCGEKALFLSCGEPCAHSLQCVMAPQAFERLKAAVEDLCDALQQPAEIALQRQLLCLVEQQAS